MTLTELELDVTKKEKNFKKVEKEFNKIRKSYESAKDELAQFFTRHFSGSDEDIKYMLENMSDNFGINVFANQFLIEYAMTKTTFQHINKSQPTLVILVDEFHTINKKDADFVERLFEKILNSSNFVLSDGKEINSPCIAIDVYDDFEQKYIFIVKDSGMFKVIYNQEHKFDGKTEVTDYSDWHDSVLEAVREAYKKIMAEFSQ